METLESVTALQKWWLHDRLCTRTCVDTPACCCRSRTPAGAGDGAAQRNTVRTGSRTALVPSHTRQSSATARQTADCGCTPYHCQGVLGRAGCRRRCTPCPRTQPPPGACGTSLWATRGCQHGQPATHHAYRVQRGSYKNAAVGRDSGATATTVDLTGGSAPTQRDSRAWCGLWACGAPQHVAQTHHGSHTRSSGRRCGGDSGSSGCSSGASSSGGWGGRGR